MKVIEWSPQIETQTTTFSAVHLVGLTGVFRVAAHWLHARVDCPVDLAPSNFDADSTDRCYSNTKRHKPPYQHSSLSGAPLSSEIRHALHVGRSSPNLEEFRASVEACSHSTVACRAENLQ